MFMSSIAYSLLRCSGACVLVGRRALRYGQGAVLHSIEKLEGKSGGRNGYAFGLLGRDVTFSATRQKP
jgi:hypothetical protein